MLHREIDLTTAQRLDIAGSPPAVAKAPAKYSGRMMAALVLLSLPVILVGLLFRSCWNGLLAAGRASTLVFEVFADEYSRPC